MKRASIVLWTLFFVASPTFANSKQATIGSKKFTEAVILGEIAVQAAHIAGGTATHLSELGGTRTLWNALLSGEIDLYAEYTGTIIQEILKNKPIKTFDDIKNALKNQGILMTRPLGFNNTYAVGMQSAKAQKLGIQTISDLKKHPNLELRFSHEFMDRADGWKGLKAAYGLPHTDVLGLEHHLSYRSLAEGIADLVDLYSTDAEIAYYKFQTLEDDRGFFPQYQALFLYREDLAQKFPALITTLKRLEGKIDEARMIEMNALAKIKKISESKVAAQFSQSFYGQKKEIREIGYWERLWGHTQSHLILVILSMLAAVMVAIPLGIVAAKQPRLGQGILSVVSILQTIPSLALLVFMIPFLGIGALPAIAALFIYSLLPIVRNTYMGITSIPLPLRESALALGLRPKACLKLIELPLAFRAILTGVKTATIINIGTATLGALIGAGGYGQPILTGIRLDNIQMILLEGAVPAAVLALVAQAGFELLDSHLTPKGLQLKANQS